MAKKGSHLNKHKVTPKPKLAAIIGKKPVSYGEAAKALWNDKQMGIKKLNLNGEAGDGETLKVGKKVYDVWKAFANGKKKIAMTQLGTLVKQHSTAPKK
jgi:chromatin remodeling complex protein RSC6